MQRSALTDAEIETAFTNTNFGRTDYRELLARTVFKKMLEYHCGHTITVIMHELKLIGKTGKPTKRGIQLVCETYGHLTTKSG